ncbi:MAG: type IIL restriction-modification enzyme MmeI [Aliidongia sp.]
MHSVGCFQLYNMRGLVRFGLLNSRLHQAWVRTVSGQLETRIRYAVELCYNTFPVSQLSATQVATIEENAMEIIAAREAHPGKTLEWLYDPNTMPTDLLQAHRNLDDTVERVFIGRPFKNDIERLEHLFKLYALMTKKQASEPAKKTTAAKALAAQGAV